MSDVVLVMATSRAHPPARNLQPRPSWALTTGRMPAVDGLLYVRQCEVEVPVRGEVMEGRGPRKPCAWADGLGDASSSGHTNARGRGALWQDIPESGWRPRSGTSEDEESECCLLHGGRQ
ncbi:hypothetical protein IMZ48_23455 [Candidatus Bathyarchaeota archaeon]|nr:hypothetical protein [Candidatus Bathyarchaeota archaeon]